MYVKATSTENIQLSIYKCCYSELSTLSNSAITRNEIINLKNSRDRLSDRDVARVLPQIKGTRKSIKAELDAEVYLILHTNYKEKQFD